MGVATARESHSAMGAPGGGEWALEAATVGHSQFLPSFVSEESPLERGTPSPRLKASSSVRHTSPQLLRLALPFHTPGLYFFPLPRMLFSSHLLSKTQLKCHLLLEGFLDFSFVKFPFVLLWQFVSV